MEWEVGRCQSGPRSGRKEHVALCLLAVWDPAWSRASGVAKAHKKVVIPSFPTAQLNLVEGPLYVVDI